jgi:hypothetical protein
MNHAILATISLIVAGVFALVMINCATTAQAQSNSIPIVPVPPPVPPVPLPPAFAQHCVNNGTNVLGPKDNGKQILNQENQCTGTRNNVTQPPTSNQPPIANAGIGQTVSQGSLVTLDGTGSFAQNGATIVSYSWIQTSGTPVSLTGANTATPTFTAPTVTTSLSFSLAVTDSTGAVSSPSSPVFIFVR